MGSNFNIHLVQHSLKFFTNDATQSDATFVLFLIHAISACRLAESVSGEKPGQST